MAVGDTYKLRVRGTVGDQTTLNVFYYNSLDEAADAEALCDSFSQQVFPAWQACIGSGATLDEMSAENLNDPTDWHTRPLTLFGDNSGLLASPFVAASISYRPADRTFGTGGKRIAGLLEDQIGVEGLDPAYQPLVDTLAALLISILVDAATELIEFFIPVIVRRITLPPNPGPIETSPLVAALPSRLGSQVSRKSKRTT